MMTHEQQGGPESTPADKDRDKAKKTGQSTPPETDPALNNPDATPGTGMLPTVGDDDPNIQPSS